VFISGKFFPVSLMLMSNYVKSCSPHFGLAHDEFQTSLENLQWTNALAYSCPTSVTKKINFYDAGTRVWLFCRVPRGSECTGLQCCRPGDQLKRKTPESLKNSTKNWHTYTGAKTLLPKQARPYAF
jgi:hypothetical protein